ncbi:hypothetical protein, partial [Bifidobacterium aquikefiri]
MQRLKARLSRHSERAGRVGRMDLTTLYAPTVRVGRMNDNTIVRVGRMNDNTIVIPSERSESRDL